MAGKDQTHYVGLLILLFVAGAAAAADWEWNLPAGFPQPVVPAGNPMTVEKVELGRKLFHDVRLSVNEEQSCATCHRQELAFTDGRSRAVGATGALHPRSAMSLANVAYNVSFGWDDPGLRALEQQALVPMFNEDPVELGVAGNVGLVLDRLRRDADYRRRFDDVFPGESQPIVLPNVVRALASFQRTLISGGSPYDRLVFVGEMDALSDGAWRGMRLFFSERLRCSECHGGFNFSGPVRSSGDEAGRPLFHNTAVPGPGLGRHTGRRQDDGAFRAPTLRNVGVTAPYMHDGSLPTLAAVIDHYAAGGRRELPSKSDRLTGFELSMGERDDLLQFLDALTDPAFLENPAFARPEQPRAAESLGLE